MPDSEKPVLKEEKPVPKPEKLKKPPQPVYIAAQLAENYAAFHASYALVASALKMTGKDNFTMSEAQKIINDFKKKR